ncbi:hypothetical protein ABER61_25970 [Brevibacillus formosus]|uniref:Uncharacterized protein n=1 Tax=Brevibacillus formosus TaxID=54913 RepID=A0ABQ0T7P3_9BACL|nr:hypothetical protein [Brevibacillus formosus]MED1957036.1 hypothetical protein [Brevibacillus formosus]GED59345.1 hypothetical protein BFO01nite_34770 [Brevibacillus formosus]
MISLPTQFTQTIIGVHKEEERLRLDSFHELIADCKTRWSLRWSSGDVGSFREAVK